MGSTLNVLEPVAEAVVASAAAPRHPKSLQGITLGVVDNGKPNADVLLNTLTRELRARFRVGEVVRIHKDFPGIAADPTALEALASQCEVAVGASGD